MSAVTQAQPKAVIPAVHAAAGSTPARASVRGYVLALLAGAFVGAAGARAFWGGKPVTETRFLNFDPESTPRATLATGWGVYERNEQGETWVWCAARSCSLPVEAYGRRDRLLRLRLWGARYADIPPQTASIKLNGTEVARMDLGSSPVVWEVPTLKGSWQDGKNTLQFDFAYAEAPANHPGGSTDPRPLAASFDWIEIIPR
jgi:hypothetical protein